MQSKAIPLFTLMSAFSLLTPMIQTEEAAAMQSQLSDKIIMPQAYAKMVARSAYIWGWPMVNMLNRRAVITKAPYPGLINGVLPAAPRGQIGMLHDYIEPSETFVACPNQDVVYGLGFFSLDEEPVIIQVPNFGSRFWVYALYDARTDQVGKIGKPYNSKPGFYLFVGPNWKGEKPKNVEAVIRSSTALANAIPRVFMDDTIEDREAILEVINQIVVYPLSQFDGKVKTIEWKNAPTIQSPQSNSGGDGETKWVIPEKFFEQFNEVLDTIPPLPGEESLYVQYRQLMNVAKENPEIMKALVETAIETEKEIIASFFQWRYNGKSSGNGWNRSVNNAEWGFDYFNRTGTSKSNMFDNRPNETQYYYTDFDSDGKRLEGTNIYSLTFPKGQLPPVKGFWSLTLYNDKHLFYSNNLKRYSLGTKNKDLKFNDDGSLTLYAGTQPAGSEKESNWLPAPQGHFSLFIRAYWGEQAILDGSWQPPKIERLN